MSRSITTLENERRERSLATLFNPEEVVLPNEYQERLVLPGLVFEKVSEVLENTRGDGREYSTDLTFGAGGWESSQIFRGWNSRTSIRHGISLSKAEEPPHLFVHSHPTYSSAPMSVSSRIPPLDIILAKAFKHLRATDHDRAYRQSYSMFPSQQDIRVFSENPFIAVLGGIVVSRAGIFVLLRNQDQFDVPPFDRKNATKDERKADFETRWKENIKVGDALRKANRAALNLPESDADQMKSLIARHIAGVTVSRFTCYKSHDPNNPDLDRVTPLGVDEEN